MQDALHHSIVTRCIPPGETLIWSDAADAWILRETANTRARWLSFFFWLFAPVTAALLLASSLSLAWIGFWSSAPVLLATLIFGGGALLIRRQSGRDRELSRSKGDIFYALTGKSFLVIMSDTGAVRRYPASAFKRVRVVRPSQPGGKNAIWFRWQAKDVGGKYTDVLHPSGDPAELADLLREHFGAKVRS